MMYYLKSLKEKENYQPHRLCKMYSAITTNSQFNKRSFSNLRIEWHFHNLIKTIYQKLTLYIILNWGLSTVLLKNPNYWHH